MERSWRWTGSLRRAGLESCLVANAANGSANSRESRERRELVRARCSAVLRSCPFTPFTPYPPVAASSFRAASVQEQPLGLARTESRTDGTDETEWNGVGSGRDRCAARAWTAVRSRMPLLPIGVSFRSIPFPPFSPYLAVAASSHTASAAGWIRSRFAPFAYKQTWAPHAMEVLGSAGVDSESSDHGASR